MSDRDDQRQFASSPCAMHELENDWQQLKTWRGERREGLLKQRLAVDADGRRRLAAVITERLARLIDVSSYRTLGFYWPIRGEIDVRALARGHVQAGGRAALPVIVAKNAPVEFWEWQPGIHTVGGVMDIPVPRERSVVAPDVLVIPLLGFDRARYRLGYGGGYYDRTLAALEPRPLTIGVASSEAELHTIYPQPHDVPMDVIVTEQFILAADAVRRGADTP